MVEILPLRAAPGPRRAAGARLGAGIALLVTTALCALCAGCGSTGSPQPQGSQTPAPSGTSSATPVGPGPSTAASGSSAPATASASASPRPAGLPGRLVGADQVPGFGGVGTWTVHATGPAGPEPYGVCQQYDFTTIGATAAVVRTFTPATGGPATTTAVERVVSFPDATNAARASRVLDSFRAHCRTRLAAQLPGLRVGTAREVPVAVGTASTYAVTWHPRHGSGRHVQQVGVVLRDHLLAVVTLETDAAGGVGAGPMPAVLAAADRLIG